MRSATPQLSRNVAVDTWPLQKIRAKAIISMSPRRMTAAFVLSPQRRPSQNPAPTATMFWGGDKQRGDAVIHTHTAGESVAETGTSRGRDAGRLPWVPQDPGFHSCTQKEGKREPLPFMGQTAQRTLEPGLRGKHPPERGNGAEASPVKYCLYRLSFFFFFFLNKSKALSNCNIERKVVKS